MFDNSILEPIQKAIWEAKRDNKKVLKIHATYDFYMQVKAKCTPPVPDIQKPFEYPIFGYSVVEHVEPCEKEWWLEIEGEPIPQLVSEAWRSAHEYRTDRLWRGASVVIFWVLFFLLAIVLFIIGGR